MGPQPSRLSSFRHLLAALFLAALALLQTGCLTTGTSGGGGGAGNYNVQAFRPKDPNAVSVKVSIQNRAVYVMEGDRPLLVTATAVGRVDSPTPLGNYTIYHMDATRRNRTYGFWIKGDSVISGRSSSRPGPGYKFTGYPMPYWSEFLPGYGFHEGSVWPVPRSKGCLRLHKNVAPKFFALIKKGTPVNIAQTQPEDATIGKNIPRPRDYNQADEPIAVLTSAAAFRQPKGPIFAD